MSIKLMTRVYEKDLPATDQRVLLVLCDHANDFGTDCYPSLDYVAWRLGADRKTVMRSVGRMEKAGVLTVDRQHRRHNRYTIDLEVLPDKPPFEPRRAGSQNATQAVGSHPEPARVPSGPGLGPTEAPLGSHLEGPKPPGNHQGEPSGEPPGKTPRPHPLPDRFRVTDQMRAWAHEKFNVTDEWIDEATEDFIDYWTSEGRKKVDWIATWRGSLRRQYDRTRGRTKPAANRVVADHQADDVDWFGRYGGQG